MVANQSASQNPASRSLILSSIESVVHQIETTRNAIISGGAMKGCLGWFVPFLIVDADILAVCAITAILDVAGDKEDPITFAHAIDRVGSRAEMEYHHFILRTGEPKLYAYLKRTIKNWGQRGMTKVRSKMGEAGQRWEYRNRLRCGAKLLEIVVEHTALLKVTQKQTRYKRVNCIALSDEAREHLLKASEELEILSPVYKPMLVPPNQWTPDRRGGYLILNKYTEFVKRPIGIDSEATHSDRVYSSINRIQSTGWRINRFVLDVVQKLWSAGGGIAGIPPQDNLPIPVYPHSKEAQPEWKAKAAKIHGQNARLVGKRLAFLRTLQAAENNRDESAIYFPLQLDFRSRNYPLPVYLQPQGNDLCRGLLEFSSGKALTIKGVSWLLIHAANKYGVDKVSMEERIKWTLSHHKEIEESARDPLTNTFWMRADDPFQFLAACREILASQCSPHYVSHLPGSVDGSNSGLQHMSAMIRDSYGASLVNLTPAERPSDVYGMVATWVKESIMEDAKSGGEKECIARLWLAQPIDRKLAKRGTMTYPYGVTLQGMQDALYSDGFLDWAERPNEALRYIGAKIWEGIRANVTGASSVMTWLKSVASEANRKGIRLSWTTPVGFVVQTPYIESGRIRISCLSSEVYFYVHDPTKSVEAHRQRNAISPNLTHSLDAAHLMMTVLSCPEIDSWFMVHDAYGTHFADMELLAVRLRQQFIVLYEIDPLRRFKEDTEKLLGCSLPPLPEYGNLDLKTIQSSIYFFA